MIVGYARARTDGQTPDVQHAALIAASVERAFAEKVICRANCVKNLKRLYVQFSLRHKRRLPE
jgi:hypothetical protein